MILLNAFDETFSQTVHTRSSYHSNEVIWGAKFKDIFQYSEDKHPLVDLKHLHQYEKIPEMKRVSA